jgi:uncharacterized protein YndB with AHSA1/START domain
MSDLSRSVTTKASPDQVWRIWSDVTTWPQWNPDIVSMKLDGPFASGTRGKMETRSGGEHDVLLGQVRSGSYFTIETDPVPMTHFTFHCKVEPAAEGSEISQEVTMKGPLAFFFRPMAGNRIVNDFPGILDGLRRAAETTP